MCGIAGFISKDTINAADGERLLDRMCKTIVHRGPDEQGMTVKGRAALGMRRLSIIDLSGGQQPKYNSDQSKFIVFNGEIYNFRELRSDLEKRGYSFSTSSDTETIIHAYDEFGPDCVNHLRGMFAFAIWDEKAETLFMARDRTGKKPLYYAETRDGQFVFGSELKVLLEHGGIERKIDIQALETYLTFGYVPEEFCIFEGVKKLLPGHFLTYKNGNIATRAYWDFEIDDDKDLRPEKEIAADLVSRLEDAVKVRLVSEVPLGAFLSGGVDSSSVVAMMSRHMSEPVKTFSIGFNEDSFNELKFARIAAKHYKTDHHEFILTPDFVDIIDELVGFFDEPFADSSALPTYMVSKLAREYVTVALSGDGGDELFGGYTRYLTDKKRGGFDAVPSFIKKGVFDPLGRKLPHGFKGKNLVFNASLNELDRYIDSVSHFNLNRRADLLTREIEPTGEKLFRNIADSQRNVSHLDRLLYLDSKTYLPSDILTKVDRMSMAASLETRTPLLDQDLIALAVKIPGELKLNGNETKYIFKKALEGIVPNEILYREKQGFGVPIGDWINAQLRDRIHSELTEQRTLERGYFDISYIRTLLDEHSRQRRDHSHLLWVLWMLELWHRRYIDQN